MIWTFFWWMLWAFYIVAYIYIVILVIVDLFRDHKLSGWLKAVWILFLIFVPFLTGLVYIIARGKGLSERMGGRGARAPEVDEYKPAASKDPAADIAQAQALLDKGAISQGEFDALKSKALGNQFFG